MAEMDDCPRCGRPKASWMKMCPRCRREQEGMTKEVKKRKLWPRKKKGK
jgi:NMD protein affecting ribosome stability and mRNA decay